MKHVLKQTPDMGDAITSMFRENVFTLNMLQCQGELSISHGATEVPLEPTRLTIMLSFITGCLVRRQSVKYLIVKIREKNLYQSLVPH